MGINLTKGQRIDLTKTNPGLSLIQIGLGWDPVASKPSGGLLSSLFGSSQTPDIDCDASVVMLDKDEKLPGRDNLVYYGNLQSRDGSVRHSGDNLTGDGDGDDEQIMIDLASVPQTIDKMVFVVNIYDCLKRKQDFGMIQNAFIRVVEPKSNKELLKYSLTDDYKGKTALIVAEIYRHNGEWKFAALGQGTIDPSLTKIIERYR